MTHPHFASIVFDEAEVQVLTCAVMEHTLTLLEDLADRRGERLAFDAEHRGFLNDCARAENAVRSRFSERERLAAMGSALTKLRTALGARAGILTEG